MLLADGLLVITLVVCCRITFNLWLTLTTTSQSGGLSPRQAATTCDHAMHMQVLDQHGLYILLLDGNCFARCMNNIGHGDTTELHTCSVERIRSLRDSRRSRATTYFKLWTSVLKKALFLALVATCLTEVTSI